jgi:hypothetical protein
MDELTQTRNHLLTTTTIRSIRVTLRHSLGLIALLGAGIGLAGCGNSAKALTPCEIQLGEAQRELAQCTLRANAESTVENAGCADAFLEKVSQVREQYGESGDCPSEADTAKIMGGLAARFIPDEAENRPKPEMSMNVSVLSATDRLLAGPGLRPKWMFPGYEEVAALDGSARTGDLSSPSAEPADYQCDEYGWCADGVPLDDESTVCVERFACLAVQGTLGPIGESPLTAASPELIAQSTQACHIDRNLPVPFCGSPPYFVNVSYYFLVCPG